MMRAAYLQLAQAKGTPTWPTPPTDSIDFIAVATLMSAVRTLQLHVENLEQRIQTLEGTAS